MTEVSLNAAASFDGHERPPITHAGTAIRAMREAMDLTLRQLAEASHSSRSYLSLVERGERTPSTRWLRVVTEALGRHLAAASGYAA